MCQFICKFYDCHCQVYAVSSFCQRYVQTRGHICDAKTNVFREECHPGEVCPSHRNTVTDDHRKYIKKIYKNLNKTHPGRNWKAIKAAATSPRRSSPLNKQTGMIG